VTREDDATRLQLAAAAQEEATLLLDLDRVAAAIEVLDAALARRDEEPDPEVVEVLDELALLRRRLAGD
jgi:hypothetical protein